MSVRLSAAFNGLAAPPNRPAARTTVSESLLLEAYGSSLLSNNAAPAKRPDQVRAHRSSECLNPPPNTPKTDVSRASKAHSDSTMTGMTTIRVGESGKAFEVHTDLLTSRSPYFKDTLDIATHDTVSCPMLDEFSTALFVRWLYGASLGGPTCFYTQHHYFGLYHLALQFGIERLQNEVMDLIRAYFRSKDATDDVWCELGSIYVDTDGPNALKRFLVAVAVLRIAEQDKIDEHLQAVIAKGGTLAINFAQELLKIRTAGLVDARQGPDCEWHTHATTPVCSPRDR